MISIIIPFHNEEESLPILLDELTDVLDKQSKEYEMIFINDGSTDHSMLKLKTPVRQAQGKQMSKPNLKTNNVNILSLRKRFGKGEALRVGVEKAGGEIIIFMDGDLQDNPQDIPKFINKINQGYDLVNGIRKTRKDNFIIRTYSSFFNWFLRSFLKSPFTDINCGFKAIKKEVFSEIFLYGNNYRFLPLAAFYKGFNVGEIEVDNRERKYGLAKFGPGKFFIGFLDTVSAYFVYQFSEKPLHFFGSIGSVFFLIGFITAMILSIERIFFGVLLYRRPALLFAILMIIVGIQVLMTGIIGELIVYLSKKNSKS